MSWIESHDTLARHPKTKRLARALGVNLPQAIGHLHLLWWWSLEYAQDGDLTGFAPDELADAALWEGDGARFVEALQGAGFLDVADGAVLIHDWEDYAGKLLQRREANRAKQEAYRNRHKPQTPPPSGGNDRDMLPSHIPDITVTSPSRNGSTVPYRTVPDHTLPNQEDTNPTSSEGADAPEIVDNFTPWAKACWDAYPARNGKKLHKAEFVRALKAAPVSHRDRITAAIENYAASSQAIRGYAEDPHRFMRHWQDWEQPETTQQKGNVTHDHHTYSDPDAIAAEIARLTAHEDVSGDGPQPVPFRRRA